MARRRNKKKAKVATDSSKPILPEKKTDNFLKPKAKKLKISMHQQSLKSKAAEDSLQNHSADKDKNKAIGEVGKESNLNRSENAKEKVSPKRAEKKSMRSKKRKEKMVEAPNSEKKLGGLIFMCSSRTKPDCFRYKLMALPSGQKEVVLGIKPGLKLFLYDFDLKLLYGIFEASSAGGMKLEPAAFGGAFPAQVRFRIYEDCLPLPENIFKNAIKQNYDERTRKFKTELSMTQVKKLKSLFRPVRQLHLKDQPASQQAASSSNPRYLTEEEYRSYGLRPELHGSRQDIHYAPAQESYRRSQEEQIIRSPALMYRDAPPAQERAYRIPAPLYGEIASTQEQMTRGNAPVHGDAPSMRAQAVVSEPRFLSENEYRLYGLRGRNEQSPLIPTVTRQTNQLDHYREDQYHPPNYQASSSDPYARLTGVGAAAYDPYSHLKASEAYQTDTKPVDYSVGYHLPRRVAEEVSYSSYASRELSDYNQRNHHLGQLYDHTSTPVSSRYSFAGASYSYR